MANQLLARRIGVCLWCAAVSGSLTFLIALIFLKADSKIVESLNFELGFTIPVFVATYGVVALISWGCCGLFELPTTVDDEQAKERRKRKRVVFGIIKIMIDATLNVGVVVYGTKYCSFSSGKWHAFFVSFGVCLGVFGSSIFGLWLVKSPLEGLSVLSSACVTIILYFLGDGREVLATTLGVCNAYVAVGLLIVYFNLLHPNHGILWGLIYIIVFGVGVVLIVLSSHQLLRKDPTTCQ